MYDNASGQWVQPQNHLMDDAIFAATLIMSARALRSAVHDRRAKIAVMTPPEREAFRKGVPFRVAKRAGWVVLIIVLMTVVFDAHLPGILGTLIFLGLPLALFVSAVSKSRKFWRTRQVAWDGWFRSQGSSLREVQEWWPTATGQQRQEFASLWGLAA